MLLDLAGSMVGIVLCNNPLRGTQKRYIRQLESREMLTPTQITTSTTEELEALAAKIEAELTRRELQDAETPAGRQAVEERPGSRGTYRRELVDCGKERCKKCQGGPSHGPYWYHYFRRGGKLTSRYIGKDLPTAGSSSE